MREYEVVHEIFNLCSGNQMRDVFIEEIEIPEGVVRIGADVFAYCSGLESMVIPEGVASIGDGGFMHCTSLVEITIPKSIYSFGRGAFAGCNSLTRITYNGTKAQWDAIIRNSLPWDAALPELCVVYCTDGQISN